ncbi:MAG: diguanylate cyclase domain-containing protein [Phycisphaerae bacterium]
MSDGNPVFAFDTQHPQENAGYVVNGTGIAGDDVQVVKYRPSADSSARIAYTQEVHMSDAVPPQQLDHNVTLIEAFQLYEQIKTRTEARARDISAINEALEVKLRERDSREGGHDAIIWGRRIDDMLLKCLDDLSLVQTVLLAEIVKCRTLEHKLSLSETQCDRHLQRALHDDLTGLPNRALFRDRLQKACIQARRHERPFAVMLIDIDAFKSINDVHGHDVGDRVLNLVGHRLQASVREEDTVARVGGDEFQCLLMEAKDEAAIAKVAKSMITRAAGAASQTGLRAKLKLSIGIALYPQAGTSPDVLCRHADAAMYAAKAAGTGYQFWSDVESLESSGWKEAPRSADAGEVRKTLHISGKSSGRDGIG